MKRSEYKKMLLEFLQLNKSSGKKKSLLRETTYQVDIPKGGLYYKKEGNSWKELLSRDHFYYSISTDVYRSAKINNDGKLEYESDGEIFAIPKKHFAEIYYSENTDDTGYSENTDDTGYSENTDDTGYSENTDDTDYSENTDDTGYSENTDDTDYSENTDDTDYSENTETSSLTPTQVAKVKEIQRIIDPKERYTGPDGDWKSGTNKAWYKYIRDNHEIINQMIKDHEAPKKESVKESRLMMLFEQEEAADYLTGKEEDGDSKMKAAQLAKKTGYSANLTGVTQFTRDVEAEKESQSKDDSNQGTSSASASSQSDDNTEDQSTDSKTLVTEISFEKDVETIKLNLNKEISGNNYKVSITSESYGNNKTSYIRVIFKNPIEADTELDEETVVGIFEGYEYITGVEIGNDNSSQDLYVNFILNDQIDTKYLSKPITNLSDDSKTLTIDLREMGLKDAEEAVIQKFDVNNDRVLKGLLEEIGTILVNSKKAQAKTNPEPTDAEVKKLLGRLFDSLESFGDKPQNLSGITSYLRKLKATLNKMTASYEKQEKLINKHIKSFERRGSRRANRATSRYFKKDIDFKSKLKESKHFRGESKMRRRNLMRLVEGYLNEQDTGYYEKTKEKYGVGDKGSDKPRASKEYDNPFEYKDQDSNNTSSPKSKKKKSVKDWEDYVNSGRHKSSKQELSDIWQAVAGEANYKGGKFKNKDNVLNFPGNYSKNLTGDGFVKWYKHIKSSEHAMAIVNKKVGQEFNAEEALKILRVLTAFDNKKQENPVFDVQAEEKTKLEILMKELEGAHKQYKEYVKKKKEDEKKPIEIKEMFNKYTSGLYESNGESFEEKLKDYQSKGREVVIGKSKNAALAKLGRNKKDKDVGTFDGINKDGEKMYGAFVLPESFSRGSLYRKRYYGRR